MFFNAKLLFLGFLTCALMTHFLNVDFEIGINVGPLIDALMQHLYVRVVLLYVRVVLLKIHASFNMVQNII